MEITTREYFDKLMDKAIAELKTHGLSSDTITQVKSDIFGGITLIGWKDLYWRYKLGRHNHLGVTGKSNLGKTHGQLLEKGLGEGNAEWHFACEEDSKTDLIHD